LTSKNKEAKTFYVKILKDKFEPNFLKIELGSVVQWNIDSDLHKKEDC
jgi:plastocyanin